MWLFTIFSQLTTGQWHHYAPRRAGVFAMIKYYSWGILSGAPHPFHKTLKRKQNPLQTWAYLWFVLGVGPALWASGFAYLLYPVWAKAFPAIGLGLVAFVHTSDRVSPAVVCHVTAVPKDSSPKVPCTTNPVKIRKKISRANKTWRMMPMTRVSR